MTTYERARADGLFLNALDVLREKLDTDRQIVVAPPDRKLGTMAAFTKGRPSRQATQRYREIEDNLRGVGAGHIGGEAGGP